MRAPPGVGGDAIDFAERQKFDDIDPALAALEPGHECLSLADLARKFRLPNAVADASIDQCFYQLGVALGSYRYPLPPEYSENDIMPISIVHKRLE